MGGDGMSYLNNQIHNGEMPVVFTSGSQRLSSTDTID